MNVNRATSPHPAMPPDAVTPATNPVMSSDAVMPTTNPVMPAKAGIFFLRGSETTGVARLGRASREDARFRGHDGMAGMTVWRGMTMR
jgi:hypothetical protein